MMLFHIILSVCAIGQPGNCMTTRLDPAEDFPLAYIGCMLNGQAAAASWLRDHPGYELVKWECADISKEDL